MTAFVRLGGIAAFVAVLAFSIALGFRFAELPRKALDIIFPLVLTASFVTAFLSTKRFFNAFNYRRADLVVSAIVGFLLVKQVIGTAAELGWGYSPGTTPGQIIDFVVVTLMLALSIFFAFRAMGFAPSGGRIWGAIGILYTTASVLATFAVVASHLAIDKVSPLLGAAMEINVVVCMLTLVAAVIVHGIALTAGAGKMRGVAVA